MTGNLPKGKENEKLSKTDSFIDSKKDMNITFADVPKPRKEQHGHKQR